MINRRKLKSGQYNKDSNFMEEHNLQVIAKYLVIAKELLVINRNVFQIFRSVNKEAIYWKKNRMLKHWKKFPTGDKILDILLPFVNGFSVSELRDAYEELMFSEFKGETSTFIGGINPLDVFYGRWGEDDNTLLEPIRTTIKLENPTRPSLKDIKVTLHNLELLLTHAEMLMKKFKKNRHQFQRFLRSGSPLRRYIALLRRNIRKLQKIQHEEALRVISRFVAQRTLPTGSIDNLLYRPPDGLMGRRSCREIESLQLY